MPRGKNKKWQSENEEDKCAERLKKRREKKRKNSIENASSISVGKEYTVRDLLKMETRSEQVLRLHNCQLMPTVKQRQQHEFCRRQLTQYLNNSSDTHFSLDFSNIII